MEPARQKRKEEINSALTFIQSSLAFPEHESYQDFLTKLVCNLLEEGNAFFKDRQWEEAVREFTEGLNVSCYAEAEEIQIPEALLESLYVNRATAYHSMGEYDRGVQDCDSALEVCKESRKALYRKALCLKELGKYKDAYSCTTNCLRITPLDKQVNELAKELAVHLGLKIRKPYVSTKFSGTHLGNGTSQTPLSSVAPVNSLRMPRSSFPSSPPSQSQPGVTVTPEKTEALEDSELIGDDLDSLLDGFPTEQGQAEAVFAVPTMPSSYAHSAPSALPAPTPQLPPAFFSSAISQLNSLDSFSSGGHATSAATLDILDDLSPSGNGAGEDLGKTSKVLEALNGLDSLDSLDDFSDMTLSAPATEEVNGSETELDTGEKSLDELLDELDVLEPSSDSNGQSGVAPNIGIKSLEQLDALDALDLFPSVDGAGGTLPAVSIGGTGLDSLSNFSLTGVPDSHGAAAPVMRSPRNHCKERDNQGPTGIWNPLSSTHEFLQACSACFLWEGPGIKTSVHKPDLVHSCVRDILLCRRKADTPSEWTRVRPLPSWKSFGGQVMLCREVQNLGFCKYGENCTFAYNQLEIDVWMAETQGKLDRDLLFEAPAVQQDPVMGIIRLLQENKGMFIFLCQECYDCKPTIISRRSRDNQTSCSNLHVRHNFDANKCLAFVVSTHSVTYRKVRPLSILCRLDLCRKAVRYGCQREDSCPCAHSVIELKTWRVQQDTGVTPEEIVKISSNFYDKQEQKSSKQKGNRVSSGASGSKPKAAAGGAGKSLPMRMKFVCAQCWRDGVIMEPDRNLKYCTAKARHTWCKERPVLMVRSTERSKWVLVRPLPHAKNFPVHYDLCTQILEKKKCNYSGNCTFAHSQEEREMWMYMKNNDLRDMQQMYDMWLTLTTHSRQVDVATQSAPEEKCIVMPTDFAEPMSGFHCRLCGRHSNSERQWQQHISTEKHKDRVFSCEGEDEALTWSYRFPGTRFKLCSKLDGSCPDGVSCDFAHSPEELQEWTERRDFLRQKLAKAREDMLIMPDEFDFGKYNFLLQD